MLPRMTFAKCKLMGVELFWFGLHIFAASNVFTSASIADIVDGLGKLTTNKLKIKCYITLIQLRAFSAYHMKSNSIRFLLFLT